MQGSITLAALEALPLWGVKIDRVLAKENQPLPAPWKK
jgi:hypothetical protein